MVIRKPGGIKGDKDGNITSPFLIPPFDDKNAFWQELFRLWKGSENSLYFDFIPDNYCEFLEKAGAGIRIAAAPAEGAGRGYGAQYDQYGAFAVTSYYIGGNDRKSGKKAVLQGGIYFRDGV